MATHKTKPVRKKRVPTKKSNVKSDKKVAAKKNPHVLNRFVSLIKQHKLLTFLIILLLLVPTSWGYERYKDWDNAQFIKGLAQDFPELVSQIEAETGLELPIKVECMTTGEKFTRGVKVCELIVSTSTSQNKILKAYDVAEKYTAFQKGEIFQNEEGYRYKYRNKNSCNFRDQRYLYFSCITAVREPNVQLAKDVLIPLNEQ